MINRYTRTILYVTISIFLYFFIFVGYEFAIAFSCACLYLSTATAMYGLSRVIDILKGNDVNDSQKSD